MKNVMQIVIGLAIIVGIIYLALINWLNFFNDAIHFVKGGLMILVFLIGIVLLILGISESKNK